MTTTHRLRVAEAGDVEAQLRLAQGFLWGEDDIPLDRTRAIYWFQKSAENGNVEAMFRLGWCVEFGFGKDEDHIAAMKYYRQAAEGGNSEAMDRLGRYYLYDDGISQDTQEAARWFRLAAEKGDHLFASIAHCPLCGKSLFEKRFSRNTDCFRALNVMSSSRVVITKRYRKRSGLPIQRSL